MKGETGSTGTGVMQRDTTRENQPDYCRTLVSVLKRFIGRSGLGEAIRDSLKDICRASGASNALLYLAPDDGRASADRYEWRREKVCLQTRLTLLPQEVFAAWMESLEKAGPIHIEDLKQAPAGTRGHHEALETTNMRSLLVMPLEAEAGPEGLLALATTSEPAAWREEDVARLQALAGTLAEAVECKRGDEILKSVDKVRALVLDSVSELVTLMDLDLKILWGNRAAAESLGLEPQQLIGRHCYELWHGRDEACVVCPVMAALNLGRPESGDVITPDGRMWHINGYPVRNPAGEIVGVAEVTSDITEFKRTTVELRKSEEKFRNLVEHSLQGVVVVQDYRIVFANPAMAELAGYSIKELISMRPSEVRALVHPDDQDMVWSRFRDRIAGKRVDSRYRCRIVRKDGSARWVEMFATRTDFLGKPGVQATIVDVTSQKRLEEKLREDDGSGPAELIS